MSERRKLPDTRPAITHRFSVGGVKGYITVGLYEEGAPGEVFLRMAKAGSTLSGLLDGWAVTTSLALQYGVPLEVLINKLSYTRFEPAGFTGVEGIGYASSVFDYVARWLALRFLSKEACLSMPPGDGPPCPHCGVPQVPDGAGWICSTCQTSGKGPVGP
mgnify:CR=1 FL=1